MSRPTERAAALRVRAAELHGKGLDTETIATRLGVQKPHAHRLLCEAGVVVPKKKEPRPHDAGTRLVVPAGTALLGYVAKVFPSPNRYDDLGELAADEVMLVVDVAPPKAGRPQLYLLRRDDLTIVAVPTAVLAGAEVRR